MLRSNTGRRRSRVSTNSTDHTIRAWRFHLARGPIHAIGNGSDPARFRPDGPDGGDRAHLRAQIATSPDRPAILLIGRLVAEKGYPDLIAAMLSDQPVVATDIRGSREEVVDGETGLLVPVADAPALAAALSRLSGNPAPRALMGKAGHGPALEHYDEAAVVAQQIRILGGILPSVT